MEKAERRWLYILIAVFVVVNVVTLSSLIPWQTWQIWQKPDPSQVVNVAYDNYVITMDNPVEIKKGSMCSFRQPLLT